METKDKEGFIHCSVARIRLLPNGIIEDIIKPGAEITIKETIEELKIIKTIAEGEKRPGLVNIIGLKKVTRESRCEYTSNDTAQFIRAIAMLVDSPLSRVIGNFYLGLNKTPFPFKMFGSRDKALQWLEGSLNKES